jgi:hypothetical protein
MTDPSEMMGFFFIAYLQNSLILLLLILTYTMVVLRIKKC